jgi:hypothetical protein
VHIIGFGVLLSSKEFLGARYSQSNELTDYLICSFGLTTRTGFSRLLDGAVSHDRIQRFLASSPQSGKDLWKVVKPYVHEVQSDAGV